MRSQCTRCHNTSSTACAVPLPQRGRLILPLLLLLVLFLCRLLFPVRPAVIPCEIFLSGLAFPVSFGDFRAYGKVGCLYCFLQALCASRFPWGLFLTASMLEGAQDVAQALGAESILGGGIYIIGNGNKTLRRPGEALGAVVAVLAGRVALSMM